MRNSILATLVFAAFVAQVRGGCSSLKCHLLGGVCKMNLENPPESLSVDLPNCIRSRELCRTPSSVELPPCQCCFKSNPCVQNTKCQEKFDGRGKCYATVQPGMDCVRGLCPHPYSKEGCYCCAPKISEEKCYQDPNCSQQFEGFGRCYPMSQEGLNCHKDLNVLCAQTGCKCCQPPCETSKECYLWGQSQGFKEGGKCIDLASPPKGLSMCARKDMCNPKSPSDTLINKWSRSKKQCWCCV